MSGKPVRRLTLFKIPKVEDQERLLEIYRTMPEQALKVSRSLSTLLKRGDTEPLTGWKPYIVSVYAGKTFEDQRAQGYTVAVVSEFANLDDFTYYDTKCEAHSKLKAVAKTLHEGNMMLYFEPYF